jgi:hypothetical protein
VARQALESPTMKDRLQRWGERALGQVRSVSPRIASRFEPESAASPFEEKSGFREIEVETPARKQPLQIVSSQPRKDDSRATARAGNHRR